MGLPLIVARSGGGREGGVSGLGGIGTVGSDRKQG